MNFNPDYYYHIYNRGVDKRKIFLDKWDYVKFLEQIREFNNVKPVYSLYWKKKYEKDVTSDVAARHRM